jgi:hypothetical protein
MELRQVWSFLSIAEYFKLRSHSGDDSSQSACIRRTEQHFELASVSRKLVEKFSRRTELIEQRARDKYKVLEAQARALMKSTNMAFDDACAHVIAEVGGDWDKWKSEVGARNRESSAKYKARQELATLHGRSQEAKAIQASQILRVLNLAINAHEIIYLQQPSLTVTEEVGVMLQEIAQKELRANS